MSKDRKRIISLFFIIALCAAAAACGSIFEQEPVGIGPDISELKRSPCACMQLDLKPGRPEWLVG